LDYTQGNLEKYARWTSFGAWARSWFIISKNRHVYEKRALDMKCFFFFGVTVYPILFAFINVFREFWTN